MLHGPRRPHEGRELNRQIEKRRRLGRGDAKHAVLRVWTVSENKVGGLAASESGNAEPCVHTGVGAEANLQGLPRERATEQGMGAVDERERAENRGGLAMREVRAGAPAADLRVVHAGQVVEKE